MYLYPYRWLAGVIRVTSLLPAELMTGRPEKGLLADEGTGV
jgi:hypothetical protein